MTSDDQTPVTDKDRLNVRDNLQMAISDHERNSKVNPLLKVAGRGLKSAKETASKTVNLKIDPPPYPHFLSHSNP